MVHRRAGASGAPAWLLLLACLWTLGASRAIAQTDAPAVSQAGRLVIPKGSLTPVLPVFTDSLPCPDCVRHPKFWRAGWQLILVQLIPWSFNRIVRDAEWADVGPSTWATNLENPWQWDNNKFVNNQFSHPYHGSLYFNSARANGYSFWTAAPWAFGGSLMWEEFGEAWAPAPNDFLNTSLGGITLGEMLWHASSLALDNHARGAERTFREIGATLLDPVRGFNRLIDGQMNDIAENPADWRPSVVQAALDVGLRHSEGSAPQSGSGSKTSVDQPYFNLMLTYGGQVDDLGKAPFSAFTVQLEVGSKTDAAGGRLSQLRARGNLLAKELSHTDKVLHQLALFMTYDYVSEPTVQWGGQGFQGGVVSRWGPVDKFHFYTEALAIGMPVVAVQSDYFITVEGRDYDYGVGIGARAEARAIWPGRAYLRGWGTYLWEPILSGFNGDHYQSSANLEGRVFLGGRVGAGAMMTWYRRRSDYKSLTDTDRHANQFKVFASLAIPRWEP